MASTITLVSNDAKPFVVEERVARRFGTIRHMLEVLGDDGAAGAEAVPLANVSADNLRYVVQWATQHKDDPLPPENEEMTDFNTDNIPEWDAKFFKDLSTGGPRLGEYDHQALFELILAANFLEIKDLRDLICKTVANMLKGKTAEEIRKMWGIKDDFSKAEQEEVKKENEWSAAVSAADKK